MDRQDLVIWMRALRSAWMDADPTAFGELFTEDALYQAHPFEEPLRGRVAIIDYWLHETSGREDVEVRLSEPLLDGDRASVEWWAVSKTESAETTDAGCLVLDFTGKRCSKLHEYWMLADHRVRLPENWG
jgi:SnoaL-like domain